MNIIAYVGCRTTKDRGAHGKGIKVYRISNDGKWGLLQLVPDIVNPSYLCMDNDQAYLYCVQGDGCEISSWKIKADGKLAYLNTVSTYGTNPVHLSIDQSNRWVFVGNLQTGNVSVIPRNKDGLLENIRETKFISGNGGPGYISHPHQVLQDNTRNWLLVPTQGRLQRVGKIVVYRIDSDHGTLIETFSAIARSGAEPRHCVFHPNNRFCYAINEKDCTITFYRFDERKGILAPQQILPTLPDTYVEDGWASDVVMEPSGRFIYVSNRKANSISVFAINQNTGLMHYVQTVSANGNQPRFITIDYTGKRLLVANELSDTMYEFDIDKNNGTLVPNGTVITTENPVCVIYRTIG